MEFWVVSKCPDIATLHKLSIYNNFILHVFARTSMHFQVYSTFIFDIVAAVRSAMPQSSDVKIILAEASQR